MGLFNSFLPLCLVFSKPCKAMRLGKYAEAEERGGTVLSHFLPSCPPSLRRRNSHVLRRVLPGQVGGIELAMPVVCSGSSWKPARRRTAPHSSAVCSIPAARKPRRWNGRYRCLLARRVVFAVAVLVVFVAVWRHRRRRRPRSPCRRRPCRLHRHPRCCRHNIPRH